MIIPFVAITTPSPFDITNLSNQSLSTVVTTNAITVSGINVAVSATTTLGTIVKNGLDTGLASTTVNNGNTVALRLTTAGLFSTIQMGTLTIGGVTDNFSVMTEAVPAPATAPGSFAINVGALTNNNRPTLSWAAVAGTSSYEVKIDAGAFIDIGNTTTYQVPTQVDGAHTFVVRAKNTSGSGPAASSVGTTIDTVAPSVVSSNLGGFETLIGVGNGSITFSENIASVSGLRMVFVFDNSPYPATGIITGSIAGSTLNLNYTDTTPLPTHIYVL